MIQSFFRYLFYVTYRRAQKSSGNKDFTNRKTFSEYWTFLMIASVIPAFVLITKFRKLEILSFLHVLPSRSFLNLILYFIVYSGVPMLIISLFIKKSYLENLVVSDEEIKKNKYILWGLIFVFIAYFVIKRLIH